MSTNKTIIIGAGLGGLAAAIRLRCLGHTVEIWEKNSHPGGKLQELRADGFRWDMGPSLLTMPHVLCELFTTAEARMEDYLDLVRLPNACRYHWRDGTVIDEDESFWQRPEVARFLDYARGIYELSGEAYLNYAPEDFWRAFSWKSLTALRHLPKVATFQSLADKVDTFFTDPHLRQLFYRFATYNGSSPYQTPATFNIIPYVEHHFGAWYPRGGLARISEALARLAVEHGVTICYQTQAQEIEGDTLVATDGRRTKFAHLICNQDVLAAAQSWLRSTYRPDEIARMLAQPLSCSGFVLFLGVQKRFLQLGHHNIFFSNDYGREFTEIFREQQLPHDPTIYVAITARTDADHAPAGQDNFFVLVNSPSSSTASWTPVMIESYADQIITRLEQAGLQDLSRSIVHRTCFSAKDFAQRDLSHHGSLYGWASHSIRSSLLRPPLRHPHDRRIHFVGGTTHPGGGIPLVLLSARMVAEKIGR